MRLSNKRLDEDEIVLQISTSGAIVYGVTTEGNLVYWNTVEQDWYYVSNRPRRNK